MASGLERFHFNCTTLSFFTHNHTQDPTLGNPPVIPNQGPSSGGTPLNLNGTALDIGTNRSVIIGETPCDIVDVRYVELQ